MHLTASEWAVEWGGKKDRRNADVKSLPFDCCALSFTQFEHPVCAPDGAVFDLLNIMPFLAKYKRHPLTGEPLAAKQLLKLHFHRNADGKYHCPVLFKPFNEWTHIAAIRTTGHVYCYEAIQTLCLKAGNMHDLLTETPFTKADILILNDPKDDQRRRVDGFAHVRDNLKAPRADAPKEEGSIRANAATARVLEQVAKSNGAGAARGATASTGAAVPAMAAPPSAPPERKGRALDGPAPAGITTMRPSTHHCAAGFTSTVFAPVTVNTIAPATALELEKARYAKVRALGKKAYVQLATSVGSLNLELHANLVPRTVENFLTLAKSGYYDGTVFHRLIKNFMVQGGDPTGSGKGGESMWGKPFADEFIPGKLSHSGNGVLSMANSGPNTNGSQFFLTFKSCDHLDGLHTIFGRLVGGVDVLAAIERLPTDKDDRPRDELRIRSVTVFTNPFDEIDAAPQAAAASAAAAAAAASAASAAAAGAARPVAVRSGVGMYVAEAAFGGARAGGSDADKEDEIDSAPEPKRAKPQPRALGDFDAW